MENKVYGRIYLITNLINKKVYIGQTINSIKKRLYGHYKESKKNYPKTAISSAIKKYNKENFIIEEIDIAYSQLELNLLEGVYISWFNSLAPNGYNLTNIINGKGKHSIQTKQKLKQKANESHRMLNIKNIGNQNRGRVYIFSKSRFCGVYFNTNNKWTSSYRINNKTKYLGSFLTEEDAAKAHDIAEIKLNPDAVLNFPELRELYLNNQIIINNCGKKSNSNITGVSFCNSRNRWQYNKNGVYKRFKTKEEAETFAQQLL